MSTSNTSKQFASLSHEDFLSFSSTSDVTAHASETQVVGQDRAIKAIELGLEVKSPGYNIFVTGLVGTGKKTTVRQILERFPTVGKELRDSLFVYNFKKPDVPRYLSLPVGDGKKFKQEMKQFVDTLNKQLPLIFESPEYQERRKRLDQELQDESKQMVNKFEAHVNKAGFTLGQVRVGALQRLELFVKTSTGKSLSMRELEVLTEREEVPRRVLEEKQRAYEELKEELDSVLKQIRQGTKKFQEELVKLNKDTVAPLIKQLVQDIKDAHRENALQAFLTEVEEFVVANSDRFSQEQEEKPKMDNPLQALLRPQARPLVELQVNLVVDNSEQKGPPIVVENHPTFKNLFGGIERGNDGAESDHTNIKAGSLLRANGGYLVLNALDVLIEPGVWPHLKLEIQNSEVNVLVLGSRIPIKPEPINVELKVLMVGDARIYHVLYNYEEDFLKIFKVKAEFDSETKLTKDNILGYARFTKRIADDEHLLPFDRKAIAAICEYAARLGGKQNKLSTQLSLLADVMREADHWARKEEASTVTEKHVDHALDQRIYRVNLIEDKLKELMADGIIKVSVTGRTVGQVNGLSVLSLGDYAFGQPSRITATTAMGKGGIMNIERQAGMSGRTHTKGVAVLTGFLAAKFAQDKPLALSARICFEQNYGGIDGDSASSTEVYALLSSLAEVPLRQDLAVTGSVSQLGEIQPIGGVNEKIEGFFDVCKAKEFTGTQGVLIPHLNVGDLNLRKDVVKAVKEGKFHVYAVKHIDEGIELLTGMRAGSAKETDSLYGLVDKKLRQLSIKTRRYSAAVGATKAKL